MSATVYRYILLCLAVWLLCVSPLSAAPQPGRIYRLLILDSQAGSPYAEIRAALLQGLASFGYASGRNLQLTLHTAGNDETQGVALLHAEAARPPDLVYVGGTVATLAAKQVFFGSDQPVVFAAPTDPVGIGVIDDFESQPKANFTGVCYPVPVKARFRCQMSPTLAWPVGR